MCLSFQEYNQETKKLPLSQVIQIQWLVTKPIHWDLGERFGILASPFLTTQTKDIYLVDLLPYLVG